MKLPGIFDNLWVKLAAIILAVLLWFHVATDKVYQHQYKLPVTQIGIDENLVLTDPPPDSITVAVSATGKTLLRTDWKKKGLKLTADRTHVGRFKVDISTTNLSLVKADKVTLIDVIEPREVYFTSDRKATRELPVKSRLTVVPDEGYSIFNSDSVVPGSVSVSGPNRQVAAMEYVQTEKQVLENARNSFETKLALVSDDIYGLTFKPDSVSVFITVGPVRRKVFQGINVNLINSPRLRQFKLIPAMIDIQVAGQAEVVDSLAAGMISAIADYVLVDGGGYVPVQVVLPPSITLVNKSADSVKISEIR
ncbi:MAG: hypothetical protein CVT49_05790 [candidate division Zixibacteria bacterium HGW-Zixibacteria-1]|nr:MAG: hypothetical protein CVT49_05790 [candidate division Zixibacteria bacterium HGW-Zixibacteria-1]